MNARTKRLTVLPVVLVAAGDELEHGGSRVEVTNNVVGANGQRYLVTETAGGAIVVHEFDRTEKVSVWR